MRELSILLFRDAVEVAVSTDKKQIKEAVQRSLMPLFFHLYEEAHHVAQVGIPQPSECAPVGAQPPETLRRARSPSLPAAAELAAAEKVGRDNSDTCPARFSKARRRQQCVATKTQGPEPLWPSQWRLQVSEARVWTPKPCLPPALPRDPQALHPGRQCHLLVFAGLQASWRALHGGAKVLKDRKLQKLLETEETWRVGKCLVRMAPKPHTQPGGAPLPPHPAAAARGC